jgi:hypothetical protein
MVLFERVDVVSGKKFDGFGVGLEGAEYYGSWNIRVFMDAKELKGIIIIGGEDGSLQVIHENQHGGKKRFRPTSTGNG